MEWAELESQAITQYSPRRQLAIVLWGVRGLGPGPGRQPLSKIPSFQLKSQGVRAKGMGVGWGQRGPSSPPGVKAGPVCKCLAWHLPESHPCRQGWAWEHSAIPHTLLHNVHTLQVVLVRVSRALNSLLYPLPQCSYALPAWEPTLGAALSATPEARQAPCQSSALAQPAL